MQKIIAFFIASIMTMSIFAQAPEKMSYQSVIRNTSNVLVTNQVVGMRISILQTSPTDTAIYVETQTPTTNVNGLISLEIGGGTVVTGNFSSIDWSNGPYFIKTETDPSGGTNYNITGTSQLLSVPYALYAKTSGSSIPGPQGPVGLTGPQGDTGPQGPNGPTGMGCFNHYIGEEFGGGVIFHLWKDITGIEHGLIVALTAESDSQSWSNVQSTLIGASAQSFWNGLSNSNAIVSQAGHTSSAAALCLNSTLGGQNDWYLPSIDELSLLNRNRYYVEKTLSTINDATLLSSSAIYWSSTESGGMLAETGDFRRDTDDTDLKELGHCVRSIRSF